MKHPIRLLLATAEPWPTFRPDVAVLFGKYLPQFGVHSDLVTAGAIPVSTHDEAWPGGEAYLKRVRGGRAARHIITFFHCACAMARADRARYQALQVRDRPLAAVVGLIAARWKGLPFFYWMSFPMPEGDIELARQRRLSVGLMRFLFPWVRGHVGRFLLYRFVLRRADHIFVQSEKMCEDVAIHGIPKERMTPVVMGVDLDVASVGSIPAQDDVRLRERRVLIYLGSLDRRRRIDILFEALALVRQEYPDVLLVLAGEAEDEAQESWLRAQAEQSGVAGAILWTGWLPTREAWRYVRAAEVALSPIPRGPLLDCGCPTKTLEYLALGVPVVGNDNPDQKTVLEEGNGGMCVPLTPQDFSRAVCLLLGDPSRRRALAASGQRYVGCNRGYRTIARSVAEKYRELLSACHPRTRAQADHVSSQAK